MNQKDKEKFIHGVHKVSQENKDRAANYMSLKKSVAERGSPLIDKAKEIAEGYTNLVKSKLGLSSAQDEKVFKARREICDECQFKSAMDRCLKCGCPLAAKTRSLISKCPEKLW